MNISPIANFQCNKRNISKNHKQDHKITFSSKNVFDSKTKSLVDNHYSDWFYNLIKSKKDLTEYGFLRDMNEHLEKFKTFRQGARGCWIFSGLFKEKISKDVEIRKKDFLDLRHYLNEPERYEIKNGGNYNGLEDIKGQFSSDKDYNNRHIEYADHTPDSGDWVGQGMGGTDI